MGEMDRHQPHDPARLRISDDERQKVTEVLREAAGAGRIDLQELDERLELTWQAKTYADLVPITVDLQPVAPAAPPATPQAGTPAWQGSRAPDVGHASSTAIMGDCKRRGLWHLPEHHSAFALMGSVTLDLREATLAAQESAINATAIMGDVKVIVPAHMHVVVDGTPIMGDYGQSKDKVPAEIGPDSPTIRVRGVAIMGSVQVQRLPPRGTPRKIIGTY